MSSQDSRPLAWVLIALLGAMALTAYAAYTGSPLRRQALVVAASVLGLLGLLAIFSIGLPILLAGVLAAVAAARDARRLARRRASLASLVHHVHLVNSALCTAYPPCKVTTHQVNLVIRREPYPSPATNARTESAMSWTAIAESSRPAIRVTSRTPLSRISRRIGSE